MAAEETKGKYNAFANCHPLINFLYYIFVLGVSMFYLHPIVLFVSFLSGLIYGGLLNGWRKVVGLLVKFVLPGMLMVALINPAFNHYGVTVFYTFESGNSLTLESIVYGLVLASILGITLIWFNSFNVVLTGDKFVYLFGRLIPASSLLLSMIFRFVPKFSHQAEIIRTGQKAVGRDLSNGGLLAKIKHGLTIFSILVTWSLENGIETADSMKARGYGLKGRTAFSLYRWDKRNQLLLGLMLVTAAVFLGITWTGGFKASYNPMIILSGCPLDLRHVIGTAALIVFMNIPFGLQVYEDQRFKRALKQMAVQQDLPYYFNQEAGIK